MAAPRIRLEVWKPSISIVNDSGVVQSTPQVPALWVRCDTYENAGTNQRRGNAVLSAEIVDKIFRPRAAVVTLTNKAQDFKAFDTSIYEYQHKDADGSNITIGGSATTSKLRSNWGPFTHFFKEFQQVRLIDEETHLVLFTGHIYKIKKSFENSFGSTVTIECKDSLEILRNISLTDLVNKAQFLATDRRSDVVQYLLNLGVNYNTTKPAAKDSQGEDAVDTNPDHSAVTISNGFLWSNDTATSSSATGDNQYRRFQMSTQTLGKTLDYEVSKSGAKNLLAELTRWAVLEPHANETADNDFGYDFYLDPNINGYYNLLASQKPPSPMFNYHSRGSRLSAEGSATQEAMSYGVSAVYPVINTWPHSGISQAKVGEVGTTMSNSGNGIFIKVGNACHVGQVIQIEDEKLLIEEAGASSSQQDYFKVVRGYNDTTPASHAADEDVIEHRSAVHTMQPAFDFEENKDLLYTEAVLTFDSETTSTIEGSASHAGSKNARKRSKRFEIMYVNQISGQYNYAGMPFDRNYRTGNDGTHAAEYVHAFREDGTTYWDGQAAGQTNSRHVARIQYQSKASSNTDFGFILLTDITAGFPLHNAHVSSSDEDYVILKGVSSGRTCRLNCNSTVAHEGRPATVWGGGNTNADTNHTYKKVLNITHANDANVDDLRKEVASKLAAGTRPVMEGRFTVTKAPYYWLDGYINSVSADGTAQAITVKHKNGSAALNLSNYGIREAMLVHKRSADFKSMVQANSKDVYGYITTMNSDTSISVKLTQSQTFSAANGGDPIRIIIPIRAGDPIFVDNILADVYGEHLISETVVRTDMSVSTSYATSGENETRIRKVGASRSKQTLWNNIAKDNLVQAETVEATPPPPMGSQSFTITGARFSYPDVSNNKYQVDWGSGVVEMSDGRKFTFAASNTSDATHGMGNAGMVSGTRYIIYLDPEGENPTGELGTTPQYHLKTIAASSYVQDKDNIIIHTVRPNSNSGPLANSTKGPNFVALDTNEPTSKPWADDLLQAASLSNVTLVANTIAADKLAANLTFTNVLTLSSNGRMVTSSNLQRTGGTVNLSAGGILIDNSGIYGASAQNTTEFYILANDGKAYFGGGNGIIDKGGITIGGSGATGFLSLKEQDNSSEYRMYNSNGASLTIFNNGSGATLKIVATNFALGGSSERLTTLYCVAVNESSDVDLKENIAPLTKAKGLDFITSLNPIEYNMIGDTTVHTGFTAQEVKEKVLAQGYTENFGIYDETTEDDKTSWGLVYRDFIAPLVASIKELKERIEVLEGNG